MIIHIEPGTAELKTGAICTNEDSTIYIPKSVTRMGIFAISGILAGKRGNITVYYEGTKEEWDRIVKGGLYHVVRPDYYGAMYHHAPEIEEYDEYRPYYHTDLFLRPTVYCTDGPIEVINDEKGFRAWLEKQN